MVKPLLSKIYWFLFGEIENSPEISSTFTENTK